MRGQAVIQSGRSIRRWGWARAALVVCASALLFSACGDDSSTPTSPSPPPAPTTPAPTTPPTTSTTFTVSGTVTDTHTEDAIVGATVTVLDGAHEGRLSTTNDLGAFAIMELEGNLNVAVRAEGYLERRFSVHGVATTLDVDLAPAPSAPEPGPAPEPAPEPEPEPDAPATPEPNRPATGMPTITGTAQVGQMLMANTDAIADADGLLDPPGFMYQWMSKGAPIAGAMAAMYTVQAGDAGSSITVIVSFTDARGFDEGPLPSAPVTVPMPMAEATIDTFMPDATSLSGETTTVTLMWTTTDAVAVRLEIEPNAGAGSRTIRTLPPNSVGYVVEAVNSTTTFTLVVTGEDGLETSDEKTVMVTDEQAMIDRFVATPNSVMSGENVTLAWETTDVGLAEGDFTITAATGEAVATSGQTADSGMVTVAPTATTTYTLTAMGKNTVPASESVTVTVTAMPTPTSILAFTAEPASITDGQTATLHVMVANATGASINQNVGAVPLRPDGAGNLIGSVDVTPNETTDYELTVTGPSGTSDPEITVTEMTTVTVTPSPPAVITSFTASPNPSPYGGDVTLRWTVTNPGSVAITAVPDDPGGDIVIEMDQMANGMVTVKPTAETTYTLTAMAAGEDERPITSQVLVAVDPPLAPMIGSFSGTTPIAEGEMATLRWTTTNAESVAITDEQNTDVEIPDDMVASGMVEVMPDVGMTTYTLTATGAQTTPSTTPATETTTVTVNRAPPAVITSFAGPAGSVAFGSDVALRWATTNAETVAIVAVPVDPGGAIMIEDQMAASGLVTVNPEATTTYTLTATGGGENPLDATRSVVVTVAAERMPVIDSFTATPEEGPINQNVTLVWATTNARSVTLEATANGQTVQVPGATAANGRVSVRPTVETTYVLTAIGIDDPDRTVQSDPVTFEITSTGLRRLVER